MDTIGAEVGQKMRSAIKAKLMELGCYVDDELPDYIMVMVANKRSKAQMEDDLQLFLRSDTKVFVEWLQQVLKKLKEVTITNPEVCNSFKELKRKATMEIVEVAIKKEKKEKRKLDKKTRTVELVPPVPVKSLTDDIPVQAQNLVEKRNQNIRKQEKEIKPDSSSSTQSLTNNIVNENNFDIPSLAEVSKLEDSQLKIVENKIKEARNRIVLMNSDSEDDDDCINIKADAEDLLSTEMDGVKDNSKNQTRRILNLKRFNSNTNTNTNNKITKPPMSERLGARPVQNNAQTSKNEEQPVTRNRIRLAETLREEQILSGRIRSTIQCIITKPIENKVQKKRESVHKRLGLPSSVVRSKSVEVPDTVKSKSVMSVVKVKPRRNVPGICQANKKLLLKAVAEAQKSIALTPIVGKSEKDALFTKKYREKIKEKQPKNNKQDDKKLKNIIIQVKSKKNNQIKEADETLEDYDEETSTYTPEPVSKEPEIILDEPEYIPNAIDLNYEDDLLDEYGDINNVPTQKSPKNSEEDETEKKEPTNHQFIVTLDGLKDKKFILSSADDETEEVCEMETIKKPPSPIVFEKEIPKPEKVTPVIPDVLPKIKVPIPNSIKSKDRCKYWPNCRLKDACEFLHPTTTCKMFPMCKFGDRCLYIHPKCKFDASCTRKDCPYSHVVVKIPSKIGIVTRKTPAYHATPEICKYFPNCSNPHCAFYHPKPCRFGQYCLNKTECNFSHGKIPNKEKLTWHSNAR